MSDNIRTALYDAALHLRCSPPGRRDAAPVLSRVVGKHCESGDIVVRDAWLPADVAPGDLLAVAATGAYCRSMASNYNHVPRPPVVAVRGTARARVDRAPRDRGRPAAHWTCGCEPTRQPLQGRAARLRRRRQRGRPAAATSTRDDLAARVGAPLELAGIAVRRPQPARATCRSTRRCSPPTPRRWSPATTSTSSIEVIGGIEPARTLLLAALERGESRRHRQQGAARRGRRRRCTTRPRAAGADLYYEASVAGAIPLLRPLRESLAGDRVTRVLGIVNGTTNYILSRMDDDRRRLRRGAGRGHRAGLRRGRPDRRRRGLRRRRQGRDPRRRWPSTPGSPPPTCTARASPRSPPPTSPAPGRWAAWSSCWRSPSAAPTTRGESVGVRVHPAMIPRSHPLAGVGDAYNAVFVEAEAAGQLMFYGRGAGGAPTASAVLGDLVAVARNRLAGAAGAGESAYADLRGPADGRDRSRATTSASTSPTRPGVLAAVARRSPRTTCRSRPSARRATATTRRSCWSPTPRPTPPWPRRSRSCASLDVVRAVASVMRVEGMDGA